MRFFKFSALCLLVSSIFLASCGQQQMSKQDVLTAMDSLEQRYEWLEYQMALQYWDMYTVGQADSLDYYQKLQRKLFNDDDLIQILQNGGNLLSKEEDQRGRQIMLSSLLHGKIEAGFAIATLRDSLAKLSSQFRAEFEGEKRTSSYLYEIQRYDPNRRRRESAFRATVALGDQLAEGVEQLFRYRNQAAKRLGFNSFLAVVFRHCGLNQQEYKAYLNRVEELSRKRYLDILDNIKVKLDVEQPELWDLGFGYADINRAVDRYFPADSQLAFIKSSLKAMGFNLDKLPVYFDLDSRENKTQFSFCFPVKPPHDVRVLGNLADAQYSAWNLLHEVGHALHFTHIDQEREIFARGIDGVWMEGMAAIIDNLIYEKEWLVKYAKMPPQLVDSYLESREEQEIIWLRRILLLLDFEYEAYANPNRDLNKLYWDLYSKYLKLPRHEQFKIWALVTHYANIPAYMQNYFYADMISAQTQNKLRETYGNLIDNTDVSAFLIQNYYRFGSRYDWRELLQRGTDEELNFEYLVKAYGL
ncbi:MAG: hypothetical protein JSV52_11030 [Candidatus Zixiibacteriota bacterium]|nr:MAG: hypothetical protein JSV52_11030 [candidate division Zixibacteria bacterium]